MKRHIDIPGGYNIRDLGGYLTSDGGTVIWRKLFRSGLLTHIKDADLDRTKELGVRTICDFRATDERTAAPDKWYDLDNIKQVMLPIGDGRPDKFAWLDESNLSEGKRHHLYKANKSYVNQNSHRYKAFFEILLDESNYPILYHCTAGKDRTGFASMLLLSALGVEWDTILEDYLLTNVYLKDFAEMMSAKISKETGIDQAKVISIFQVRESFLNGALDMITEKYGTINTYLEQELNVGAQEKKELKRILVKYS